MVCRFTPTQWLVQSARCRDVVACGVALATFGPRTAAAQVTETFGEHAMSGWHLSVRALETWDSNVRLARPDGDTDLASRTAVDAARLWQTSRTRLLLSADGALVRFRSASELDRDTYAGSLQTSRKLTRRATGTFDYRIQSALTSRSLTAVGEGTLLAGLAGVRTHDVAGALTYRSTPTTTAGMRLGYQHVAFDTPVLVGGWAVAADAQLAHRQSRATSLQLDYEARRSEASSLAAQAHRLAGVWEHRLGDRMSARLTGGVSAIVLQGARIVDAESGDVRRARGTRDVAGVGGGALRLRRARDLFDGEFQHSVGQVFGRETAGLFTTDMVAMGYDRSLERHLHFRALVRHAWGAASGARENRVRSIEGTAEARYVARTGLAYSVGALASRRVDRIAITSRRLTFGVGYAWSQVRSMPISTEQP